MWLPQLNSFKQLIIEHLRQLAHPREMDFYFDIGERLPANHYIIDIVNVDDWRVIRFIYGTAV